MSDTIIAAIISSVITIVATVITVVVTVSLTFSKIRDDMRIQIATINVRLDNMEDTEKKADEVPVLTERINNHEKRIENLEKKIK